MSYEQNPQRYAMAYPALPLKTKPGACGVCIEVDTQSYRYKRSPAGELQVPVLMAATAASRAVRATPLLALAPHIRWWHALLVMLLLRIAKLASPSLHTESHCVYCAITGLRECRATVALVCQGPRRSPSSSRTRPSMHLSKSLVPLSLLPRRHLTPNTPFVLDLHSRQE